MVNFGERLKHLRKERNLTQKELANKIKVKDSVISFYELGERKPSPEVVKKLAIALHVSSDYLLGIEQNKTVDVSGLNEKDIALVSALVERLREQYN